MKNTRVLTGSLALALLLVWGRIGLQIAGAVGGDETPGPTMRPELKTLRAESDLTFPEVIRDPFAYAASFTAWGSSTAKPKRKEIAWAPPQLRLSGIVMESGGGTAMIESADGKTHFLAQGDTLSGTKVLRIASGAVTYSFRNKKGEWILDQK